MANDCLSGIPGRSARGRSGFSRDGIPVLPRGFSGYLLTVLLLVGCTDQTSQSELPGLRIGTVLGTSVDDDQFAKATGARSFAFPRDHGSHPDYRSEWWYLTVGLRTAQGREFGVQFTVFRQALFRSNQPDDPWQNGQVYLAHVALTDVADDQHYEAERLARGHPQLAGVSIDPLSIHVEGWRLNLDRDQWSLEAVTDTFVVKLHLEAQKPVVYQGDAGLSAKGPGQASYYYSLPRLAAHGDVTIDGQKHSVTGLGWLDREWSTSVLSADQIGWDWFALMLANGEDVMAFRLRRRDGSRDPFDHGVVVQADGTSRHLATSDFELQPLDYWRDERNVQWPIRWRLTVDNCEWIVSAAIDDQRMDTLLTYWEGLVHVTDAAGQRVGQGYMELTGYR